MRTLQLTHDEIALISRALGIAEMKFNGLRESYIKSTVNVRGVDSISLVAKEADVMLEKEQQFCNLLLEIESGEKDV